MKKRVITTKVGKTKLEIIEIGKGKPEVSIVAGIHGDETNSQLVIEYLLRKIKNVKGKLRIIPLANESAVEDWSRETPDDEINLNRVFPGDETKSVTHKLANKIFSIVNKSDLVIDLHNYNLKVPLSNVYFKTGKNIDQKNETIHRYLLAQNWVVDIEKKSSYAGCLGGSLSKQDIPNLTLEIPKPGYSNAADIKKCVNNLLNVLKSLKIINGNFNVFKPKYFIRKSIEVKSSGLFTPSVKLNQPVKKGGTIGILKNIITQKSTFLRSPIDGNVSEILNESFVPTEREVCAIQKMQQ